MKKQFFSLEKDYEANRKSGDEFGGYPKWNSALFAGCILLCIFVSHKMLMIYISCQKYTTKERKKKSLASHTYSRS